MNRPPKSSWSGPLAVASLFTGLGAIFAASCCVLPLVLGGLGAGAGLFSVLEILVNYRTSILVLSAGLLACAWFVYSRNRGARLTPVALTIATLFVGTAAVWDYLEVALLGIIRAHR
jgi:mercuric ion transport protein